ncbi:hypothetical protein Efla_000094 [Eimeria flavescens]
MGDPKRQKATDGKKRAHKIEEEAKEEAVDAAEGLEFEDPYGDDLDDEEQQQLQQELRKQQKKNSSKSSSSSSSKKGETAEAEDDDDWSEETETEEMQQDEDDEEQPTKVWRPGVDTLGEDEVLECDWSAYEFLHKLQTAWPCLSFDFIPDQLGAVRSRCPHTCYAVGGTQSADDSDVLYIMKWGNLRKTQHDGDSSDSEEESDEEEGGEQDARLDFRIISHKGAVNRIRCCPNMPRLVAAWSERGVVGVWDIEEHLKRLDDPGAPGKRPPPDSHKKPTFEFKGHGEEGFAMDWNPLHVGKLLTGDVKGQVYLWLPREGGWSLQNLFASNKSKQKRNSKQEERAAVTVEELQWKPCEDGRGEVFAACSNDGSIKLWDLRVGVSAPSTAILLAHETDVNSLRFSPVHSHLLLSGGEDGKLKVFDLRCVQMPLAEMDWHKKPISCVDWHPSDEAVFAASSLDDSLTVWDMSVERDDAGHFSDGDIPDQLMFVHGGQRQISEFKFHLQIPGCMASTASDGFHVFKPCNI